MNFKIKKASMIRPITVMAVALVTLVGLTSCSDWLDVKGENIQKEEDQFKNYKGFRDALTGCYMEMASTSAYGQKLTMTDVEDMASLWYCPESYANDKPASYELHTHQYAKDNARAGIKTIYAQLFKIISSANVILNNIKENGANIGDSQAREMIEGEAYAIRAYCQLDVLRLFGQVPGGTTQVRLPYSETSSLETQPAYYDYDAYVDKLEADLTAAETLLKDNDPVMSQTFNALNHPSSTVEDNYKYYRQARLNYWAVRALHARMDLYVGRTEQAHDIAMEIIQAKGADGNALISLSGISDFKAGYRALPSECLFYLSRYDINSVANSLLVGGRSVHVSTSSYFITTDELTELYASLPGATASHNRYLNEWNRATVDAYSTVRPTLKKYWYDEDNSNFTSVLLTTKLQVIPMLRLSEVYLIAIETRNSLTEVQSLYDTYMNACAFTLYQPFTSVEAARKEMMNEYRREFFGEGQMFYVYKRLRATTMMNNAAAISQNDYIVPLPQTEYEPTTK